MRLLTGVCFCSILSAQQSYNTVTLIPRSDSETGEVRYRELYTGGANYVGFKAPAAIAANLIWQLPDSDGTVGQCLTTNGAGSLAFVDCGTGGTPAGLPVVDTTSIVKGSADATKAMRFEVDGLTASTTRVLTVPDADLTIMGREVSETISGTKTFASDILAATDNTHNIGATATRFGTLFSRNVDAAPAGIIGNWTKVRKLEYNDFQGSNVFWDSWASGNGVTDSYWVLRDNAGAEVIKFVRKISGAPADWADVYVDLRPNSTGGQSLGDSAHRWGQLHIGAMFSTGHHTPTGTNAYDLGESPNRWRKLWVQDVDISGTLTAGGATGFVTLDTTQTITGTKTFPNASSFKVNNPVIIPQNPLVGEGGEIDVQGTDGSSYWAVDVVNNSFFRIFANLASAVNAEIQLFTPGAGTVANIRHDGNIYPLGNLSSDIGSTTERYSNLYIKQVNGSATGDTGSYVRTQKLDLNDVNGNSGLMDIRAYVHPTSGGATGDRYMEFRDNAGSPLFQMWRQSSGSAVNYSRMYTDFLPGVGFSGSLSLGSAGDRWGALHIGTITSTGNHTPSANNAYDQGATASRWRKLWVSDIDVSGTCTGCGGGVTSVTGTFPIASSGGLTPNITCTECVTTNTVQSITASKTFGGTSHVTFQGGATFQFSNIVISSSISSGLMPGFSNTYDLGSNVSRWNNAFINRLNITNVTSSIQPDLADSYSIGATFLPYLNVFANHFTIPASSTTGRYWVRGNGGIDQTISVRNAADTGSCTITVLGGIITSTTC